MRDVYLRFGLANLVLIAWAIVAAYQPSLDLASQLPSQLLRKYLPFALVVLALGSALVARHLPEERRVAFLARHFAVYVVVPFLLFAAVNAGEDEPALAAIYLVASVLWTAHALEGLWHVIANLTDRTGALLIAGVVLVPFLALMPYHRLVMPTMSDEPHYLVIVQSIVDDHDLDLKNQYDDETYQSFYDGTLPDRHVIHVGITEYPIRDLGLPALITVPFAIAGRLGVEALMCLIGAALAAQLYLACRDLGIAQRPALLAVAGAALTHPLLTYTTQIYPDLPAALAFVTAARLLRRGRSASLASLAGASACVGVLPWLSTRAWLIAVGVGLVVAWCALRPMYAPRFVDRVLRAAAGALPFAALVLFLAYVSYRMFGWFMPSANYYLISDQQQVLAFTPQIGALGLLFDRVFGLIPRTPLYLIAALGLIPLFRRSRGAQLSALALGWLAYFVYISDIAYWWADGSPPSRYLLAALPFLVVLLAAGIERIHELRVGRGLAIALASGLAAYSVLVTYVYAVLPNLRYDLAADIRQGGSEGALFLFLGRVIRPDLALLFPSLVRANATDMIVGAIWLLALVALVLLGRNVPHTSERLSAEKPSLP